MNDCLKKLLDYEQAAFHLKNKEEINSEIPFDLIGK
jgi:hypothetical protein